MYSMKTKHVIRLVILLAVAGVALASIPAARAGDGNHTTALPPPLCNSLQVPQGNKMAFYVYALGVQIYRWNGTHWVFVEPWVTLFAASYLDESPFATPAPLEKATAED
jgi:hypothetical protein